MQKCAQTAVYIQRETSQKRFDVTFLFKGDVLSDLFVDVDVFLISLCQTSYGRTNPVLFLIV